jgi:hypothetical protein
MRPQLPASRNRLGSYYQLAIVVPLIAIVLVAGGIGAIANGYTAAGLGALLIGIVAALVIAWFVRLPVRDAQAPTTDPTP